MSNALNRRRRNFARALDATGLSDVVIARRCGFFSSVLTRLRHSDMQPSLYTACMLVAAFNGEFGFEDFLTAEQQRAVEKVRGAFEKKPAAA